MEKSSHQEEGICKNEINLGYYMLDPEVNLLNINFATGENQYLDEHAKTIDEREV